MVLMIIVALVVFGLALGSFVNALVWRVRQQELETAKSKPDQRRLKKLSILQGRSMCPECGHELALRDLIPVYSWLRLGGKCRYCHKPILIQYPLVEVGLALAFVGSYIWWPVPIESWEVVSFGLWLLLLTGLMALIVYDLRWMLLPNRIIYPLTGLAGLLAVVEIVASDDALTATLATILATIIGGGIFYLLFQVSGGKWIGGGDVKLGWLLGLVAATPARSLLFIFLAAAIGSLISLPLLLNGRLKTQSVLPFGPLLIVGAIITQLFGGDLLHWYQHTFLGL